MLSTATYIIEIDGGIEIWHKKLNRYPNILNKPLSKQLRDLVVVS